VLALSGGEGALSREQLYQLSLSLRAWLATPDEAARAPEELRGALGALLLLSACRHDPFMAALSYQRLSAADRRALEPLLRPCEAQLNMGAMP